jgi:hypothetical protein
MKTEKLSLKSDDLIEQSSLDLIDQISELHEKMKPLLLKYAGVPELRYNYMIKNLLRLREEQLIRLYAFFLRIYNVEYKELHRIFRLPLDNSPNGPELWDRYFAKKLDFIEIRMFRAQAKIVKEALAEYPRFKKQVAINVELRNESQSQESYNGDVAEENIK